MFWQHPSDCCFSCCENVAVLLLMDVVFQECVLSSNDFGFLVFFFTGLVSFYFAVYYSKYIQYKKINWTLGNVISSGQYFAIYQWDEIVFFKSIEKKNWFEKWNFSHPLLFLLCSDLKSSIGLKMVKRLFSLFVRSFGICWVLFIFYVKLKPGNWLSTPLLCCSIYSKKILVRQTQRNRETGEPTMHFCALCSP